MNNHTKAQLNKALDTLAISVLVIVATVLVVALGCFLGIALLAVCSVLLHNPYVIVGILLGSLIFWSFIRFMKLDR